MQCPPQRNRVSLEGDRQTTQNGTERSVVGAEQGAMGSGRGWLEGAGEREASLPHSPTEARLEGQI